MYSVCLVSHHHCGKSRLKRNMQMDVESLRIWKQKCENTNANTTSLIRQWHLTQSEILKESTDVTMEKFVKFGMIDDKDECGALSPHWVIHFQLLCGHRAQLALYTQPQPTSLLDIVVHNRILYSNTPINNAMLNGSRDVALGWDPLGWWCVDTLKCYVQDLFALSRKLQWCPLHPSQAPAHQGPTH